MRPRCDGNGTGGPAEGGLGPVVRLGQFGRGAAWLVDNGAMAGRMGTGRSPVRTGAVATLVGTEMGQTWPMLHRGAHGWFSREAGRKDER